MKRGNSSKAIIRTYIKHVKSTHIKKYLKRALTLILALTFMLSTIAMAIPAQMERSANAEGSPFTAAIADGIVQVPITYEFEDEYFLAAVREILDMPFENIYPRDVAEITELNIYNRGITSLRGIEHFAALEYLVAWGNELTELVLHPTAPLVFVDLSWNYLPDIYAVTGRYYEYEIYWDGLYFIFHPQYVREYVPEYIPEYIPEHAPEHIPEYIPEYVPEYIPEYVPEYTPEHVPEYIPEYTPEHVPEYIPEYTPEYAPEYTPEYVPEYVPEYIPEHAPEYTPEYIPEYTPQDVPDYPDEQEEPENDVPTVEDSDYGEDEVEEVIVDSGGPFAAAVERGIIWLPPLIHEYTEQSESAVALAEQEEETEKTVEDSGSDEINAAEVALGSGPFAAAIAGGLVELPDGVGVVATASGFPAPGATVEVSGVFDDGDCGTTGAPWWLYSCGTLIVDEGYLQQWAWSVGSPWSAYSDVIERIEFTGPITAGTFLMSLFAGLTNVTSIEGLSFFDTSNVVNMTTMFTNASSLMSLDLRGFDTRNVMAMNLMFAGASGLITLDLSGYYFDTSRVVNMNGMFSGVSGLTSLDCVSGFDTSHVENMHNMFNGASSLTSLDLSGFDTRRVTNMSGMFNGASGLTSLDLNGYYFDTRYVTTVSGMFTGASNLRQLALGENFVLSGSGLPNIPNVPENDTYTGFWRNVGNGTAENPQGEHALHSTWFVGSERADIVAGNTWVWQRAVAPSITTDILPDGVVHTPYSVTLAASGSIPFLPWSVYSGELPPGLSINSVTGVISGTPTQIGTFYFKISVTNISINNNTIGSDTRAFSLTIGHDTTPVTGMSNVSATGTVGVPLTLHGTVQPGNATNQSIVWSLGDGSTAPGASVSGGQATATGMGTVVVTATIVNGIAPGEDFVSDYFTITFQPRRVTNIVGVPTRGTVGVPVALSGTVQPANATNRAITWTLIGGTAPGASISGNEVSVTSTGTAIVRATIIDGEAIGEDFYRDFTIEFFSPVTNIVGVPSTGIVGTPLVLSGTVLPSNAANTQIIWNMGDGSDAEGARVSAGRTHATGSGTVVVVARILNGGAGGEHFTQSFEIIFEPIPVTSVTDVPTIAPINADMALGGNVYPANATNRTIEWSVVNAGTAGATVIGDNFRATSEGIATVRAVVVDGVAVGSDFTQELTIHVGASYYGTVGAGGAPWRLNSDGTLVVESGFIHNWTGTTQSPWHAYRYNIRRIEIRGQITAGTRLSGLFAGLPNVTTIEGLYNFDTSAVAHMSSMFLSSGSLTSLDLSGWDVRNVLSFDQMFSGLGNLTSLNLYGWDTNSNAVMNFMFFFTYINELILGENFHFASWHGDVLISRLPEVPFNDQYVGVWVNEPRGLAMASRCLMRHYDGSTMSGTWTWLRVEDAPHSATASAPEPTMVIVNRDNAVQAGSALNLNNGDRVRITSTIPDARIYFRRTLYGVTDNRPLDTQNFCGVIMFGETLMIDQQTTIRAIAVAPGLRISPVEQQIFTIGTLYSTTFRLGSMGGAVQSQVHRLGNTPYRIDFGNIPATIFNSGNDSYVIIGDGNWGRNRTHSQRVGDLNHFTRTLSGCCHISGRISHYRELRGSYTNHHSVRMPQMFVNNPRPHNYMSIITGLATSHAEIDIGQLSQFGQWRMGGLISISYLATGQTVRDTWLQQVLNSWPVRIATEFLPPGAGLFIPNDMTANTSRYDIIHYYGNIAIDAFAHPSLNRITPSGSLFVHSNYRHRVTNFTIRRWYYVDIDGMWDVTNSTFTRPVRRQCQNLRNQNLSGYTVGHARRYTASMLFGNWQITNRNWESIRVFNLQNQSFARMAATDMGGQYSQNDSSHLAYIANERGVVTPGNRVVSEPVLSFTAPIISEVNGQRVMVFAEQGNLHSGANGPILMYSLYNNLSSAWGVPRPILDYGTADFFPSVASDGTNMWVVWQNTNMVFGDDATLFDVLAVGNIYASRFDHALGTFVDAKMIETSAAMNLRPSIAVNGDDVVVAWIMNTANDFSGTEGFNNRIMASLFTNGDWSDPFVISNNLPVIIDMDVDFFGGEFKIAYAVDSDNNFDTVYDHILVVRNLTGNVVSTPASGRFISNLEFMDLGGQHVLSWHEYEELALDDYWESGSIRYMTSNGQVRSLFAETDTLTSDYRIFSNSTGDVAVIYSVPVSGASFMIARVRTNETWGNPFILFEIEGSSHQFDGVWSDTGEFNLVFNNERLLVSVENDETTIIAVNYLYALNISPQVDITLVGVFYRPADVILGNNLPIVIDIYNSGGVEVESIDIRVDGSLIGTFPIAGNLLPGEDTSLELYIKIPANLAQNSEFLISAEPTGKTDVDMSDNTHSIILGHTNLALSLERTYHEDGTVTVHADTRNTTDFTAYATLLVRLGSEDGDMIDFVELGQVAASANVLSEFNFDPDLLVSEDEYYELLYFEIVSNSEELFTFDNSGFVVIRALENFEDDYFDPPPIETDPTVTAVTVTPSAPSVGQGRTQQFTATVQGTNSPPQGVTWSVTGNNSAATTINPNGLLTVAPGETATRLTVTATSTHTRTIQGVAFVTITAATQPIEPAVTVTPNSPSVGQGRTQQFTATVQGANNPPQGVTWSVTGNNSASTSINPNGLLTVATGETATNLTVRATSTHTNTVYGTAIVTVQPGNQQPGNQQPGNQQPDNQQPGNQQPGDQQPGNQQPDNQQPGNQQPDNQQPGDQQPGNQQPGNQQPDNQQPGSQQPDNQQPGNQQPDNQQPPPNNQQQPRPPTQGGQQTRPSGAAQTRPGQTAPNVTTGTETGYETQQPGGEQDYDEPTPTVPVQIDPDTPIYIPLADTEEPTWLEDDEDEYGPSADEPGEIPWLGIGLAAAAAAALALVFTRRRWLGLFRRRQ